ncbi:hypothetical protein [Streptomyces sp. GC420]|uniref:hypothetical protein n=1 Tax=Streptomyces sp. GC420 TaxID=2697568 RepID=UPI001414CCA3|nr:hypothetical protein [Streptomyces sp. GC420]NBM16221.1 hypothetical protein [Streptomyces sp. GC420]
MTAHLEQQPSSDDTTSAPRLTLIEQTYANSTPGDTILDYLDACAVLVEERGTDAVSVARTDTGHLLTPVGSADFGYCPLPGGGSVAARRPTGRIWTGLPAADYIETHWTTASAEDPVRFGALEYSSTRWLYRDDRPATIEEGGPSPALLWDAAKLTVSDDGRTAVVLEFRGRGTSRVIVWVYDLMSATRRRVGALPQLVLNSEPSISCDGRWLLVGSREVLLMCLEDGRATLLPGIRAATWTPHLGANVIAAVEGPDQGPGVLTLGDLHTGARDVVCGIDVRVDALDISGAGEIAAVVATPGIEGWMPNVVRVDAGTGEFEPILPWRLLSGTYRLTEAPRWGLRGTNRDTVELSPGIESSMTQVTVTEDERIESASETADYTQEFTQRLNNRFRTLLEAPGAAVVLLPELVGLTQWLLPRRPNLLGPVRQRIIPRLAECAADPVLAPTSDAFAKAAEQLEQACKEAHR